MATKLTTPVDFANKRTRGKSIGDFSPFADGDTWELVQGEDFDVKANTIHYNAVKWAREQGFTADYKITRGDDNGTPDRIALRFTSA